MTINFFLSYVLMFQLGEYRKIYPVSKEIVLELRLSLLAVVAVNMIRVLSNVNQFVDDEISWGLFFPCRTKNNRNLLGYQDVVHRIGIVSHKRDHSNFDILEQSMWSTTTAVKSPVKKYVDSKKKTTWFNLIYKTRYELILQNSFAICT